MFVLYERIKLRISVKIEKVRLKVYVRVINRRELYVIINGILLIIIIMLVFKCVQINSNADFLWLFSY